MTVFPEFMASSPSQVLNVVTNSSTGAGLHHEVLALENQGDYAGAATVHRQALEHKLDTLGTGSISAVISYNALGEALTQLGDLEEAERNIQNVLTIAINVGSRENEGLYRENLAMVYESSGDLRKARMARDMNAPNKFVCSYYKMRSLAF